LAIAFVFVVVDVVVDVDDVAVLLYCVLASMEPMGVATRSTASRHVQKEARHPSLEATTTTTCDQMIF
jgi:hypothetical protein